MGVAKGIQWYLVALLDDRPKCQSTCTATAKGLAHETVNEVELEFISLGCVNVKVDV